jgi:orotidine-5'-phosphate decarboxylase
MKKHKAQLILALDVDTLKEAKKFVDTLYPKIKIFKVGSQLFTGYGPEVIRMIQEKGGEVFLDLKFFDIPTTIANAVRQAVRHKVKMMTMHILGDAEMLGGALAAAEEEAKLLKVSKPLLIGVTVLTSKESQISDVITLARIGLECGLDGIVCSAREIDLVRKEWDKDFVIVTPGIRPNNSIHDDQKRTATVKEAMDAGSDFLVVGRPILKAQDPLKAAEEFIQE